MIVCFLQRNKEGWCKHTRHLLAGQTCKQSQELNGKIFQYKARPVHNYSTQFQSLYSKILQHRSKPVHNDNNFNTIGNCPRTISFLRFYCILTDMYTRTIYSLGCFSTMTDQYQFMRSNISILAKGC